MSTNQTNTQEAIQKNSTEEWYNKLKNIPTIREFELKDWKEWAEYNFTNQKESNI